MQGEKLRTARKSSTRERVGRTSLELVVSIVHIQWGDTVFPIQLSVSTHPRIHDLRLMSMREDAASGRAVLRRGWAQSRVGSYLTFAVPQGVRCRLRGAHISGRSRSKGTERDQAGDAITAEEMQSAHPTEPAEGAREPGEDADELRPPHPSEPAEGER